MTAVANRKPNTIVIQAAMGAVLGFLLSYSLIRLFLRLGLRLKQVSPWDVGAFLVAISFVGMGLVVLIHSANRRLAGRALAPNALELEPATRGEMRMLRLQAVVLMLGGVALFVPLLVGAMPVSQPMRAIAYALVLAVFAGQTGMNVWLLRHCDEYMRRIQSQVNGICFWGFQGLLFLVGAAEKLGLAPSFSLWDAVVFLLGFYLVTSIFVSIRVTTLSRP